MPANPTAPLGHPAEDTELTVEFLGTELTVHPEQTLTFGRSADLVLDGDNLFLHRVVGRFAWNGAVWILEHLGTRTRLVLRSGRTVTTVAPGGSAALLSDESTVHCDAGAARYEFAVTIDLVTVERPSPVVHGSRTVEFGWFDLNDEQFELLVALASRYVTGRDDLDQLPSNRSIAHRLGWSITKFNRKLDHLCAAAARAGVVGVSGDLGSAASQRRARLVEHAARLGMVTAADVDELGFTTL